MKQYDVVIKYQEFRKNALSFLSGDNLVYEPNEATEIGEFGTQAESEQQACDRLYHAFNHVDQYFAMLHPNAIPQFKKAGHTSMSVGDIIEFMVSGNVYVVAGMGFKLMSQPCNV